MSSPQISLRARQPAVVAVGHRHQLHAGHLQRDAGIVLPLAARANQRNLNVIVRGDGCAGSSCATNAWTLPASRVAADAAPVTFKKLLRFSSCMQHPPEGRISRRIPRYTATVEEAGETRRRMAWEWDLGWRSWRSWRSWLGWLGRLGQEGRLPALMLMISAFGRPKSR